MKNYHTSHNIQSKTIGILFIFTLKQVLLNFIDLQRISALYLSLIATHFYYPTFFTFYTMKIVIGLRHTSTNIQLRDPTSSLIWMWKHSSSLCCILQCSTKYCCMLSWKQRGCLYTLLDPTRCGVFGNDSLFLNLEENTVIWHFLLEWFSNWSLVIVTGVALGCMANCWCPLN